MIATEVKLTKWGNGGGILIPKEVYADMKASIGDTLSLVYDEKSKTASISNARAYTMQSLMKGYDGPKPGEIDAPGSSTGRELW